MGTKLHEERKPPTRRKQWLYLPEDKAGLPRDAIEDSLELHRVRVLV